MTTNTIQLVELDGSLHTSYDTQGRTEIGGKPVPWTSVRRVADFKPPRSAWMASHGTAEALRQADERARALGWAGIRVTEPIRAVTIIVQERAKYDRWVEAQKPDPRSASFSPKTMRWAYIKRPNETNHQWGGAVDLDVFAWAEDGKVKGLTGNASLAVLWGILAEFGFTPIIADPNLNQSEAWHFDHLGPLAIVRDLFRAHRLDGPAYGDTAACVATVGCILAGTYSGSGASLERLVQARLLIAGHWCGFPDGVLGKQTRAALAEAGLPYEGPLPGVGELLGALDAKGIGLKAVADA